MFVDPTVLVVIFIALIGISIGLRRLIASSKVSAGIQSRKGDIACPRCGEFIKAHASVCRFCQCDLDSLRREAPDAFAMQSKTESERLSEAHKGPELRIYRLASNAVLALGVISVLVSFLVPFDFASWVLGLAWVFLLAGGSIQIRKYQVAKSVVQKQRNLGAS